MVQSRSVRRYRVHARHLESHHGVTVEEPSFEAAVVSYVEAHGVAPDGGSELSVLARDLETGREHCFRIDLETGQASSCD